MPRPAHAGVMDGVPALGNFMEKTASTNPTLAFFLWSSDLNRRCWEIADRIIPDDSSSVAWKSKNQQAAYTACGNFFNPLLICDYDNGLRVFAEEFCQNLCATIQKRYTDTFYSILCSLRKPSSHKPDPENPEGNSPGLYDAYRQCLALANDKIEISQMYTDLAIMLSDVVIWHDLLVNT